DELLGKAGYRRAPDQSISNAFPRSTEMSAHCEAFPQDGVITKIKASGDEVGFCLRYQPAFHHEMICDGSRVELANQEPFSAPALDETIYVALKFIPDNNELSHGTLSCITKGDTAEL